MEYIFYKCCEGFEKDKEIESFKILKLIVIVIYLGGKNERKS
jgi:hypothetical protein